MKDYFVMEYLYRDANNFKAFGKILLDGKISENDVAQIMSSLEFGEYFIAEQVNIPVLYPQLWKYSNGPTIADHAYHELSGFHPASVHEIESMALWGQASVLFESFNHSSLQWDCTLSAHCLSI